MAKSLKRNHVMEAKYNRAQILLQGIYTENIVLNATLFPVWIGDSDCFWYERQTKEGKEYRLVNAKKASNKIAFDHNVLAGALALVAQEDVNASDLPLSNVELDLKSGTDSPEEIRFNAFSKRWVFKTGRGNCEQTKTIPDNTVISPNGRFAVFVNEFNLWIRDIENNKEVALTHDGEEDYVYAALGTAWGVSPDSASGVQVLWSADSKKIFTVQRDTRQVMTLPVVQHVPKDGSVRPIVEHIKVAYPGDEHVETLRLLSIDIDSGKVQTVNYRQIPVTRNSHGFFDAGLGWWSSDCRHVYFVDMERDYRTVRVVKCDTQTGAARILFEETSSTQINLMLNGDERPSFIPILKTDELIWFSERSGWAHIYLYDLATGELKHTITEGKWLVRDVLYLDFERREVFIQTAGRVPEWDPYYRDLVRVHIDTGEITTLASSDHEYTAVGQKNLSTTIARSCGRDVAEASAVSCTGNFAVVTRSRADEVPVSLLVDRFGKEVLQLEMADISALPENWRWPEPVKLLAADGKTDIYGLIFRPSDFSPDKSYPVVSHLYSVPDFPWVAKGSFSNGPAFGLSYLDAAALAELGFIVIQIDGRGVPYRNKAFQDESYGHVESVSKLEDHITGIRQLAERYPYLDLERVGVTTHTAGGSGALQGLLCHPEFYKVGVCMRPHDSRLMSSAMWNDKYAGGSGSPEGYRYPEEVVDNLEGKLLLMNGMLDWCNPPAGVFRLVEALQKANKDFDLLLLPNISLVPCSYQIRRAWDYLVKNLLQIEPPKEFKLTSIFS